MPPFDDVNFRKALSYAVDKEIIAEKIYSGLTKPSYSIIPPGFPGYSPSIKGIEFNEELAKEYLAKSLKNKTTKMKYLKKDDIDNLKIFKSLPPLIKAYLRVGSWIGEGAVIDKELKTTDVCIILKVDRINTKYLNMAIYK